MFLKRGTSSFPNLEPPPSVLQNHQQNKIIASLSISVFFLTENVADLFFQLMIDPFVSVARFLVLARQQMSVC